MKFRGALAAAVSLFVAATSVSPAPGQARVPELQARFEQETNGVQKAKLFVKLGEAQLQEAHRAAAQPDFSMVGLILEKYRDNLMVAMEQLKKQRPNAEKKPAGYRPLEMHVREGLREIDDFLLVTPQEYRPPLELVRQDVEKMEDELLRSLFPHRPGEKPLPAAPPKKERKPSLVPFQRNETYLRN